MSDAKAVPTIEQLQKQMQQLRQENQIQMMAMKKIAGQRETAMNQICNLEIQLEAAQQVIQQLTKLQSGKVELKEAPKSVEQGQKKNETNAEVAQRIADTPVGA